MKMTNIAGKRIKINARTIVVIDENDKTQGMVTNVQTFDKIPTWDQIEFWSKMKQAGIEDMHNLFFVDGKWYYIIDDRQMNYRREYVERGIERPELLERWKQKEDAAIAFGAVVVHVTSVIDTRMK